jgi:aldehyde dehydrogenase (NAD+)
MKSYDLHIAGQRTESSSGEWIDSIDPYRGEVWARVPRGNTEDVDRAVQAATNAMRDGPWAAMSGTERGKLMRRMGDLVSLNAERLAQIEVRDNGKLYAEMLPQLKFHAEWWWYYAGLADKLQGTVVPVNQDGTLAFTTLEPVGVVAAIIPWNSPLLALAFKVIAAIAAGCAVVVKPSEHASVSTLEFAELTTEAGFPPGVFNVVTGFGAEAGKALVEHPEVAKVSFTGSDAIGREVYASAAKSMKRVSLELGGKSPNIVFADCNMTAAVSGAVSGIFSASGQACTAGSRLFVQNSIRDEFVEQLRGVAATARIGDPMSRDTNIGPISTQPQFRKVMDYIEIAKSEGARCVLGGAAASGQGVIGGQFVEPTIFVDVTNDMRIAREEVFGPVVSVIGFEDEADVVQMANDTIYGLAAGVWTKDIGRAVRVSKALKAGTVWVNTYRAVSVMMPFGGMKHSGVGRENGIDAAREFLEVKSVWLSDGSSSPANPFVIRVQ